MEQLTKEQVIEKFSDVDLRFKSYYKYSFEFEGVTEDGYTINCYYGTHSDDIYKFEVSVDRPQKFLHTDNWNSVDVFYKGKRVYHIDDDDEADSNNQV